MSDRTAILFEVQRSVDENDWPWKPEGTLIVARELLAEVRELREARDHWQDRAAGHLRRIGELREALTTALQQRDAAVEHWNSCIDMRTTALADLATVQERADWWRDIAVETGEQRDALLTALTEYAAAYTHPRTPAGMAVHALIAEHSPASEERGDPQ